VYFQRDEIEAAHVVKNIRMVLQYISRVAIDEFGENVETGGVYLFASQERSPANENFESNFESM
jgi:hypothetical protein